MKNLAPQQAPQRFTVGLVQMAVGPDPEENLRRGAAKVEEAAVAGVYRPRYANFSISNAAMLVPTFNDVNDRVALGILSELFNDRPVVGIHAVDLVWGLGTLHCLTHDQPAT